MWLDIVGVRERREAEGGDDSNFFLFPLYLLLFLLLLLGTGAALSLHLAANYPEVIRGVGLLNCVGVEAHRGERR